MEEMKGEGIERAGMPDSSLKVVSDHTPQATPANHHGCAQRSASHMSGDSSPLGEMSSRLYSLLEPDAKRDQSATMLAHHITGEQRCPRYEQTSPLRDMFKLREFVLKWLVMLPINNFKDARAFS